MSEEFTEKEERELTGELPGDEQEALGPVEETAHEKEGAAPEVSDEVEPSNVPAPEEYQALLQKAQERDLFLDELLRTKADFENYRKRVLRERPNWEARAVRQLVHDLLPIVDNFERALSDENVTVESLLEGIRMVQQMYLTFLESHGVHEIEALSQPFDPHNHEAIQQVSTDDPGQDGLVVEVLQKGYAHGDTVIRPAKVLVAKKTDAPPSEA